MDTKMYKLNFFHCTACLVIHTCDYRRNVYFTITVSKKTTSLVLGQDFFFLIAASRQGIIS